MKFDSAQLTPDALALYRRSIMIRATKHGVVGQSYPRAPRKEGSLLQKQYRTRFGLAARMASNPEPLQYLTAVELAKGTEQVPRDILTMAALGNYYIIVNPDGSEWGHVEGPVFVNPVPDVEEEAMFIWPLGDSAYGISDSTSPFAAKGYSTTFNEDFALSEMAAIVTKNGNDTLMASCAEVDAFNNLQNVTNSEILDNGIGGHQFVSFPIEKQLKANVRYAFQIVITSGSAVTPLRILFSLEPRWHFPVGTTFGVRTATSNPSDGETIDGNFIHSPPIGLNIKPSS